MPTTPAETADQLRLFADQVEAWGASAAAEITTNPHVNAASVLTSPSRMTVLSVLASLPSVAACLRMLAQEVSPPVPINHAAAVAALRLVPTPDATDPS